MTISYFSFNMNDPDDKKEFERYSKSWDMYMALGEIKDAVFRPARKHGYQDSRIQELIDRIQDQIPGAGEELIGLLEDKFFEILNDIGVNLP